jgi:hypothetical protein
MPVDPDCPDAEAVRETLADPRVRVPKHVTPEAVWARFEALHLPHCPRCQAYDATHRHT